MKGTPVRPTEQNTKTPFATTGFFASLRAFLGARGSGAPKTIFRLIPPVLATAALGALVCTTTPALAASPPTIEEQFTTEVASTSATLNARVNPQGAETSYTFQYAPSGGEFKPVPEPEGQGSLPEGLVGVPVSVHAQHGLAANTAYRFRLLVSNSAQKETLGEPVSFTTQAAGGEFTLSDGRQYEMVTPPQKHGALLKPLTPASGVGFGNEAIQASANGDSIIDAVNSPIEAEPQGYQEIKLSLLSTRGPSRWSSQMIAAPHPEAGPAGENENEYFFFADDLSHAILQPLGNFVALSPQAIESTAYLRTDYLNQNVSEHCEASYKTAASCFQPLVSVTNDTAVPFQPFGEAFANGECGQHCGPRVEAGTPDLRHLLVSSPVQLTSTPITTEAKSNRNLYEWSGGQLQLVSILPGANVGSGRFILAGRAQSGIVGVDARHAISNDGGRVFLATISGNDGNETGLYLRDVAGNETVRLDVPQGGATESVRPEYMTASSDGSQVFFLDAGRLTPNSGAVHGVIEEDNKPDLYEYDLNAPEGQRLTDLTPKTGGESAAVAGVLGASVDGSYVYFAAAGDLAPGAQPGGCEGLREKPALGESCNVYVYHEGVTTLVARLGQEDQRDWTGGSFYAELPVRVAPHGRWLAFMSDRGLTGYDTHDALTGRPDQEVYLYDASSNRLRCTSCNPTGARPVGSREPGGFGLSIAGIVPGWTAVGPESGQAHYQSRALSDSGRLFFDSYGALVPKDANETWDVYQYEPEGVPEGHACTSATGSGSIVFKPAHSFEVEGRQGEEGAGCMGLISSGASSEPSTFLDASETGGDVFFLTSAKLSSADFDTAPDVYDAHECTAASPCLPESPGQPPACTTADSCRAAPTPQPDIFGTPASGTFSGPGNLPAPQPSSSPKRKTAAQIRAEQLAKALRACRKKHGKPRTACERQARKRYGASKATARRRAGR
jgi:hypothetical protein